MIALVARREMSHAASAGTAREPARALILYDARAAYERLAALIAGNGQAVEGQALSDCREAGATVFGDAWGVVVLSLTAGGVCVLEIVHEIRRREHKLPLLVHCSHSEQRYAQRVLRAGACAYTTSGDDDERLRAAIRRVSAGRIFVSAELAEQMARDCMPGRQPLPHTVLTDREYQLFLMMVDGHDVLEIADMLNLSVRTVRTHKSLMLRAMGMPDRAALLDYARQHGLER